MKIDLPSEKDLVITNDEDPLKYYYWPVTGYFYKKRLTDVLSLVGSATCENLLEIGFGSGLLFPELSQRASNLFGLEVHDKIGEVNDFLLKYNLKADLRQGDILNMPFADNFFDFVVSVSTLEHIKDLELARAEICQVLKPGGTVVLGFPVRNAVTDLIFRLCGRDPRVIHPSSHRDIIKVFSRGMKLEKTLCLPQFLPMDLAMYVSARFRKM